MDTPDLSPEQYNEGQCFLCRTWDSNNNAMICFSCRSDSRKIDELVYRLINKHNAVVEAAARVVRDGVCVSITDKPDFDMSNYLGCSSGTSVERIEINRTTIRGSVELQQAILALKVKEGG